MSNMMYYAHLAIKRRRNLNRISPDEECAGCACSLVELASTVFQKGFFYCSHTCYIEAEKRSLHDYDGDISYGGTS